MSDRVVVMTTQGSHYGFRVLNGLTRQGTPPVAILVQRDSFARKWKLLRGIARRNGWIDAVLAAVARLREQRAQRIRTRTWRGAELVRQYAALGAQVHHVDGFRSDETLRLLGELKPDWIVLAQTGIVTEAVLRTAAKHVLNAHPGWLPDFKGVDAARWALVEGRHDRLGSSLHFVDAGIDTGALVEVRPLRQGEWTTCAELEDALYEDCVDLLLAAVKTIAEGRRPSGTAQPALGKQYYRMPRPLRRESERRLLEWRTRGSGAPQSKGAASPKGKQA